MLLRYILEQFTSELSESLPDNNNYPPEIPAWQDPSTDEYTNNCAE